MDETPFWRQGKWLRAAAIVAAIAIIVAIAIAARITNGRGHHTTATASTVTRTGSSVAVIGTPKSCDPPAADQTVPSGVAPGGIRWETVRGIALPVSPTAGPLVVEASGMKRCYARSPVGALLAVANLAWRPLTVADPVGAVEAYWLPGTKRAKEIQQLQSPGGRDVNVSELTQIAGFQFVSFSPEMATISLARVSSNGGYQMNALTVRWVDGDWRLDLENSSDQPTPLSGLPSTVTPWSAI